MDMFIQAFKKGYLENLAKRKSWKVDNVTTLQPGDICILDNNNSFSKKKLWPLCRVLSLVKARDKKTREAMVQLSDADYKVTKTKGQKEYTVLRKPTVKKVSIQQLRRLQSWSTEKVTSSQPEIAGTEDSVESYCNVLFCNIVQHSTVNYSDAT